MGRAFPNRIQRTEPEAAPGHRRREQLRVQADQLEEQAETLAAEQGVEAIDPNALLPDDEIQSLLSRSAEEISNPVPGFSYMWVNVEYPQNARGSHVLAMQAQGWHVVKGDIDDKSMPESIEHRTTDGTRKLGDCLLMRIDSRRKAHIDYQYDLLNARRMGNDQATVDELSTKYGIKVVAYDKMTPEAQTRLERQAATQFAKRAAMERVADDLRNGTVPGVPAGR